MSLARKTLRPDSVQQLLDESDDSESESDFSSSSSDESDENDNEI